MYRKFKEIVEDKIAFVNTHGFPVNLKSEGINQPHQIGSGGWYEVANPGGDSKRVILQKVNKNV